MERRNFDSAALTWDEEPRRVQLANDIAAAVKEAVPLSGEWDGMDFGCGTGLLAFNLVSSLRSMTGLDSSTGMVERLNAKSAEAGVGNLRAFCCNLEQGETPPAAPFHFITSAMTLHHIPETVPLLVALRDLMHPGGWIALADLETEDGSFHENHTGLFHYGFSREELESALVKAGFSSILVKSVTVLHKQERSYPVLLAVAVRP